MFRDRYIEAALIALTLIVSACDRSPKAADAPSRDAQAAAEHKIELSWQPKWDTAPDKSRRVKSALTPTLSFADQGFRGSPVAQNESGKEQERKNRESFVESFRMEPQCFGITLKQKNPGDVDFALQVFNGIDGRTGRWQWVLYRMDTFGERARGEVTGVSPNGIVQSVCSSVHDAVFLKGGEVE